METKYSRRALECKVLRHLEHEHPGVVMVAMEKSQYYLSGPVEGLNKPVREFLCKTPAEVRDAQGRGRGGLPVP